MGLNMRIRPYILFILYATLIYFVTWTILYVLYAGVDLRYYFTFLYYAWTGPGEVPGIIQFYTILFSLVEIAMLYVIKTLVSWYKNRQ